MAGNMYDRCQCFANASLTDTACIGEKNDPCIFFEQCKQAKVISLKLFGKKNDAGEAYDYGELNEVQRQQVESVLKGGEKPAGRARPAAPKAEPKPVKTPEADTGSPMDDLERELEESLAHPVVAEETSAESAYEPVSEPVAVPKPKRGRKPKAAAEPAAEQADAPVEAVQESLSLSVTESSEKDVPLDGKNEGSVTAEYTLTTDQSVLASAIMALASAIEKLSAGLAAVPQKKPKAEKESVLQPEKKEKPAAGKRGRPKKK